MSEKQPPKGPAAQDDDADSMYSWEMYPEEHRWQSSINGPPPGDINFVGWHNWVGNLGGEDSPDRALDIHDDGSIGPRMHGKQLCISHCSYR